MTLPRHELTDAQRVLLRTDAQESDEQDRRRREEAVADADRVPMIVILYAVDVARDRVGGERCDDESHREAPLSRETAQDDRHVEEYRCDQELRRR